MAITVEPLRGQRYQGVVPLVEESLAASLDAYFRQSEQLGTRLWLAADGQRAGGLLLQQLPTHVAEDPELRGDQWQHACSLAATVTEEELLELDGNRLLHRLYHQDPLRLFEPSPVSFHCSCSRERTRNALATLDRKELEELLAEHRLRPVFLFDRVSTRRIAAEEFVDVDPQLHSLLSVNDPGEYHKALSAAGLA